MKKWGNYWLDLVEFENYIKTHIIKCINIFVGKRYSSSLRLRGMLTDAVRDCLEEIAKQEKRLILDIDYELELEYENDTFTGFKVTRLHADGI